MDRNPRKVRGKIYMRRNEKNYSLKIYNFVTRKFFTKLQQNSIISMYPSKFLYTEGFSFKVKEEIK